ncbi:MULTISPECIES: ribbon-helix-helix domain-containing protein [Methylosinus]|uniref:Type II toxin-antitoxin system ParD family antitoxin n=1 Tax=Methylosinus trichosporium (strain ATCC 35070 / NCIMB 11131 / UNIQEM 75 / OB3b) TaxID=595536 RepID=A0A2D2CVV4_METT3|nr:MULTISPECIES: hypothetical protein [Methylosinus]ATQ66850.1 type II toxin-antitoxin system ParD family antitoxin [Methylosinus trichosporium OB3b]OBS54278.1 CopG family transcriptional regulator [Methylosinus sp. 3S-1]
MRKVEEISILLAPDLLRAVRESIAAGEFASPSEALGDAVRVWRRQRAEDAERLASARERIRRSLEDPRSDVSMDEVEARLLELHAGTEARLASSRG